MRAAVYYGREDLRVEQVADPRPAPDEVKLRVRYNGLCGSDLHEYYHGPMTTRTVPHPLTGITNPVIMGHELSGEVVEVGQDVDGFAVGDLVAVEPVETCGHCLYCSTGQYNHCGLLAFHGYNRAGGGLADYTCVKQQMAHKLPAGMTALQGALIEPMAISRATALNCQVLAGQTVALHGAGPIGVGIFLLLRHWGVHVIVCDPSPMRRSILRGLGARDVLDPSAVDVVSAIKDLTAGRGAHVSVDAAGVPAAFDAAFTGTAVGGRCVVVAIHTQPLQLQPLPFLLSDVQLSGVALSCNAFPATIADMAAGVFPIDSWTTQIALEDVVAGFGKLHRQEAMKLLVAI